MILVNQTISPLMRGGGWGVIRYVTPQRLIRLTLQAERTVEQVTSLLGADVTWTQEDAGVVIEIQQLDLYDHLTITYGETKK